MLLSKNFVNSCHFVVFANIGKQPFGKHIEMKRYDILLIYILAMFFHNQSNNGCAFYHSDVSHMQKVTPIFNMQGLQNSRILETFLNTIDYSACCSVALIFTITHAAECTNSIPEIPSGMIMQAYVVLSAWFNT